MDKIPQKGILGNITATTPNTGVVLGVPQKNQIPQEITSLSLDKERLPESNKVLEPTEELSNDTNSRVSRETPEMAPTFSSIPSKTLGTPAPTKEDDEIDIPTIRTYKKDVAGTIADQKTTLVHMILDEQKDREKKEEEESPKNKKNFSLLIFSVVLFFATLGIVYYAFLRPTNVSPLLTELNVTPLVNVEISQELSVDNKFKKDIIQEIQQEITKSSKLDTVKNIFFTETFSTETEKGPVIKKKLVTASEFFEKTELSIPSMVSRTVKDEFMFGYHSYKGNQPFLILKTDYYDNAFSGMLAWENTLSTDLQPLFKAIGRGEDLKGRTWRDVVTKNKDTRVLNNFDGSVALVYMFKDPGTLIITTNNDTLFELSKRLDLITKKAGI